MQRYVTEHINQVFYTRLSVFACGLEAGYKKKLIHYFRVDIKKLRAFYRLLSLEAGTEEAVQLPRRLKKMYSCLGALRDLQQHESKLKEFSRQHPLPGRQLRKRLKDDLKKAGDRKGCLLPEKYFAKHAASMGKQLPPQLAPETLRQFFIQKQDHIRYIVACANFSDEELHSIRKDIKDMMYVADIYTEELKSSLALLFWQGGDRSKLDALAKDLGDHNDLASQLSWLREEMKHSKWQESKKLTPYLNALIREKKTLRDELISKLQRQ
ncbi:MAG: CHAD domain-containing protein [Bacteroidetes bacterium]|nr:CHAD domain-containing protein [Bacteroidota bacterium]